MRCVETWQKRDFNEKRKAGSVSKKKNMQAEESKVDVFEGVCRWTFTVLNGDFCFECLFW